MRLVVQRVQRASVAVDGELIAQIGQGLLVLIGVAQGDQQTDVDFCAQKIAQMRIFEDADGKMNLSVQDLGMEVLLVSQFTLLGDVRKGRRPSFSTAAPPDVADALYLQVADTLRAQNIAVQTGKFRAHMEVSLVNDGPVTIMLDSGRIF